MERLDSYKTMLLILNWSQHPFIYAKWSNIACIFYENVTLLSIVTGYEKEEFFYWKQTNGNIEAPESIWGCEFDVLKKKNARNFSN